MRCRKRGDRGIALPVAVFALVVVAVLIGGAFFVSMQEQRLATDVRRIVTASGSAEAGLAEMVRTWDPGAGESLPVYPAGSLPVGRRLTPLGTGSYQGLVYKLNDDMYLVSAHGTDTAPPGPGREPPVTRLGLLVRSRGPGIPAGAALTTAGAMTVGGGAAIDGRDAVPNATWTGCAPGVDTAAIRVNGTVAVAGDAVITGAPPIVQDTAVTDSTFDRLGDVTYQELVARAEIVLPPAAYAPSPSASGGTCDRRATNWGDGLDRTAPCGDYFPVVHVAGDLTLEGGQGQGMLLVDGDLDIAGPFRYAGVVLVRGVVRAVDPASPGPHLWGAVLIANRSDGTSEVAGNAVVSLSTCVVRQALRAGAFVAPLRSRGWARLF